MNFIDATDKLDDRVKGFFMNAKRMKPSDKDSEFESVRKEYYKALEDAGKFLITKHKHSFDDFINDLNSDFDLRILIFCR